MESTHQCLKYWKMRNRTQFIAFTTVMNAKILAHIRISSLSCTVQYESVILRLHSFLSLSHNDNLQFFSQKQRVNITHMVAINLP